MKKRILSMLLIMLMLLPMIAACKDETPDDNGLEVGTLETEEVPVAVRDLGDRTFKILSVTSNYGVSKFAIKEEEYGTGNKLDDSIYRRNKIVEERLSIEIIDENIDPYVALSNVEQLSMAGTYAYDVFANNLQLIYPLAVRGYFLDSDQLGNDVNLSASWWSETATKELLLNGKNYVLIGAADLHYYESTCLMAYNKTYANSLSMPNFAEMALEGNWTLEELYNQINIGHNDPDESSDSAEGTIYGLTTGNTFIEIMTIAAGESVLAFDEDHYPSFKKFNARTIDLCEDISAWIYRNDAVFVAPRDNGKLSGSNVKDFHGLFQNSQALFYMEPVGSLDKLRNVTFEFTVLPFPKYEATSDYITPITKYAVGMFVPITVADSAADVGMILENLMYQSEKTTLPVYIDEIVNLQRSRNEDSYKVLTEIVWEANSTISLLHIFNWGSLSSEMINYASSGDSFATLGASLGRAMDLLIENSIGAKKS